MIFVGIISAEFQPGCLYQVGRGHSWPNRFKVQGRYGVRGIVPY
jgi:hypothetical protein